MAEAREFCVSVVSHAQNALVNRLLADLRGVAAHDTHLVVTQNVPDAVALETQGLSCEVLVNEAPKGFGANHNAAFRRCRSRYFAVVNPDIRLHANPLAPLAAALQAPHAGAAGPLVRSPAGGVEDSARRFPTLLSLLGKLLRERRAPGYAWDRGAQQVDWIAGMFMLFEAETYRAIGGFDESYFLYYEDVDLCRRLHRAGKHVIYEPRAEVVHDARRASRRNPRLAVHHLASMLRYLFRAPRSSASSLESSIPHTK